MMPAKKRVTFTTVLTLLLISHAPAHAQLEKTRSTLRVDLKRSIKKYQPKRRKKPLNIKRGDYKGLYGYKAAATRALLPLRDEINRCVNVQRFVSGEFSERLDFFILPTGKLKKLVVRGNEPMRACILPHMPRVKFPPFSGRKQYRHVLLIASQGYRIGRRTKAKVIDAYPVETRAEKKKYRIAAGWVVQPWTGAMGDCAECVDQSLGAGYTIWFAMGRSRAGRPQYLEISVEGQQSKVALRRLAPCAVPFARALRAPRHKGKGLFLFRSGTRTASWERD